MKNGYLIALLIVAALCAAVFGYYKLSKPAAAHTAQTQDISSPFSSASKSPSVNDIPGSKTSSLDPTAPASNDDPFVTAKTSSATVTPNAIVTPVVGPAPATQPSDPFPGHSSTAVIPPAPIRIASSSATPNAPAATQPSASAHGTGTKHDAGTSTVGSATAVASAGTTSTYTVQSGDVLGTIAQKTLGTAHLWKEIAKANPDVDPGHLKVGQVLKIPAVGKPVEAAKQVPAAPAPDHSTSTASAGKTAGNGAPIVNVADTGAKSDKPAKLADPAPAANAQTSHVVEAGETLSSIARDAYPHGGGTWKTIYNANKAALNNDPNHLAAGMKLIIPAAETKAH